MNANFAPRSTSVTATVTRSVSRNNFAPTPDLPLLTPPECFGIVEPGLYRSSIPKPIHYSYIEKLRLKSVILLSAELPTRSTTNFFKENRIQVFHLGLDSFRTDVTWKPVSEELIKESLEMILSAQYYPLLICDTLGINELGLVVGCLRKLQSWNLNSVVNEYRSYAGSRTRYINEQFIELFDLDLVTIPDKVPPWLEEQITINQHEESEFAEFLLHGKVNPDGTIIDTQNQELPSYLMHYYSQVQELNSFPGRRLSPNIREF